MDRSAATVFGILCLTTLGCETRRCMPSSPCPGTTPGAGTCANIAGSRNAFFNDNCNRTGSGVIVLSQSGCSFNGNLPGLGTFTGTVSGSNLSFTLQFTNLCSGTATGTATVASNIVSGTYSGTQSGPSGSNCCSPVSGHLSFDFAPTPVVTPAPTPTP